MFIRQANEGDMEWINSVYHEIEFLPSDYNNEYIAVASNGDEKRGVGRLVTIGDDYELGGIYVAKAHRKKGVARDIVMHLLQQVETGKTVYCIPFIPLESFYRSCGFENAEIDDSVPQKIQEKIGLCNDTFQTKTLLMKLVKK